MSRFSSEVQGIAVGLGVRAAMAVSLMAAFSVLVYADTEVKVSQVIVERVSDKPYAQVVARVEAAVKGARFMIIGEPNYQMMQRMVGRERRGSKAYYIFRPDLGIPVFDNDYNAAMAIPIKVLIYEREDHKTVVRYVKPSSDLANYKGLQSLGQSLDKQLNDIVSAALK